jgi:hypothetical protein
LKNDIEYSQDGAELDVDSEEEKEAVDEGIGGAEMADEGMQEDEAGAAATQGDSSGSEEEENEDDEMDGTLKVYIP